MTIEVSQTRIGNILTRAGGYLSGVCSHSLQPYRGCSYGNALCGVGCYVQHSRHLLKGRRWGSFLEVRMNAAQSYREHFASEARWGRSRRGAFSIFCSSATDPFVPQERRYGITRSVLAAMLELPPDQLILQTHSHRVCDTIDLLVPLSRGCDLRVHISIESDLDRLPGLPPPASSVAQRLVACRKLRESGLHVVVTVAPLLPIADPDRFFRVLSEVADAVVVDHFIQGDGTDLGTRTTKTRLPAAMQTVDPESVTLAYRDRIAAIARNYFPGKVGVGSAGFAGDYA